MINRLQPFMRNSKIYENLFDVQSVELTDRADAIEDLKQQILISTATWALEVYERAVGLPVDNTKPLAERRSRIIAKLRGVGKVDAQLIKNVVSSWTGGTTDVQFGDGTITIRFIDTIGIPENMSDVELAIEEIKPAHLSFVIEYIFNTHAQLSAFTHAQLSAFTHDQLRNEVLI